MDGELKKCRICGSPRDPAREPEHGTAYGNTARYRNQKFHLWKCPRCETVHALDPVDFHEIYKDYPPNIYQKMDFFAKVRFGSLLKRLLKQGIKKESRILDWGCGNGVFLEYLKGRGYLNVFGYDPYVREFSTLPKIRNFDAIIANDVIEHVDDPRALRDEILQYLKPGGILYMGTADSSKIRMNHLEKYFLVLHQPFHRVIITQNTLEKLGRERIELEPLKSYTRSYMDTLVPFVNYRALEEFQKVLGKVMDNAFLASIPLVLLKRPYLFIYGFLGYFLPSAYEPAVIWRKKLTLPAGSR